MEGRCAILYSGGNYHLEKFSQTLMAGSRRKSQVYEATLAAPALQVLQQLLDDPDLRASQRGNVPDGAVFFPSDSISLWVPRDKTVQHLEFAGDVGLPVLGHPSPILDHKKMKLIRPLERWVKSQIPADKQTLVEDAVANLCAPK